jgi:diguanylate cyclase (GGDEF)-like protein/PAS domain S-box-containing protein
VAAQEEHETRQLLSLARDTFKGIAAYVAWTTGDVTVVASPGAAVADLEERVRRLAGATIARGRAEDGDLIWEPELAVPEGGPSDAIASVAVPVTSADERVGTMGIVDFWRPDIADELRETLVGIAGQLAALHLAAVPAAGTSAEAAGATPPSVAEDVASPGVLEEILESIEDGVVVCDHEEVVVVSNRQARLMQGAGTEAAIVGRPFPFSIGFRTAAGTLLHHEDHPLARALRGITVREEHHMVEDSEGKPRHLLVSARPLEVGGSTGGLLVIRDVTAQLAEEARLTQIAMHDQLTGLANRYLLLDHLQRSFRQVQRRGGALGLVYLDLDDFKAINDSYGHDAGDEVLVAVGRRLEAAARAGDLVSRFGGDEFVIVAHPLGSPDALQLLTERIRSVLSAPYNIAGQSFPVGSSVGAVLADAHRDDPNGLLALADAEMYRHKQANRSNPGEQGF